MYPNKFPVGEEESLTLEQARLVANEIRRTRVGGGVDRAYWPWVIETLCNTVETLSSSAVSTDQYVGDLHKEVDRLRKELDWLRAKTIRGELDTLRTEKTNADSIDQDSSAEDTNYRTPSR